MCFLAWLIAGDLVSVPGRAHLVGHACHLLLELAVARPALGVGDRLCGLRDLGHLGLASTAHVRGALIVLYLGVVAWWISIPPRTIVPGGRKSR